MNLIEQHMENVAREEAHLEERLASFKAEQEETRKLLGNIKRYRKSLCRQYPSSQATLPLAPLDEDEATDEVVEDEADLAEAHLAMAESDGQDAIPWEEPKDSADANTLTPEQISAASEKGLSPSEYSEGISGKPIRRRKAKAAAEE